MGTAVRVLSVNNYDYQLGKVTVKRRGVLRCQRWGSYAHGVYGPGLLQHVGVLIYDLTRVTPALPTRTSLIIAFMSSSYMVWSADILAAVEKLQLPA